MTSNDPMAWSAKTHGTAKAMGAYKDLRQLIVDVVRMEDGDWLLCVESYVLGPLGDHVAYDPPVQFVCAPPAYLSADVDVSLQLLSSMAANVVLWAGEQAQSKVRTPSRAEEKYLG
jgi:hypothetical protein